MENQVTGRKRRKKGKTDKTMIVPGTNDERPVFIKNVTEHEHELMVKRRTFGFFIDGIYVKMKFRSAAVQRKIDALEAKIRELKKGR